MRIFYAVRHFDVCDSEIEIVIDGGAREFAPNVG
jgi:hypothetical protein